MIGLQHYLLISALLFVLSIAGIILNRRNLILMLMCIELMLLAVNFNFVAFSRYLGDETGHGRPVPQPALYQCAGTQRDEGLNRDA
jgi:NADH:ubiquinone oxidoreductase subunit K